MTEKNHGQIFDLTGKNALIIGGGGVLGFAIAEGLSAFGAKVAISSRTVEKAQPKADSIGAMAVAIDGTDLDSIETAGNKVEAEFGNIDILINAAGGNLPDATATPDKSFFDLPADAMRSVVDINLMGGAILPSQIIGKRMVANDKPTSIINITSMAAMLPLTRIVGYSAAKAAVTNFTQWLSVHMALDLKSKVRVNAIAPGFFLTDQNRFLLTNEKDGSLTPRGETIISQTPMGRFGEADELIGAAIWLASDASSFVNGIVVPVDGGFSAFSGV